MKPTFMMTAAIAMLLPGPALAEPTTRTITIDTPNFEGERVITRDREAGLRTMESTLTRKEDGAVATRSRETQRTDSGVIISGSQTRFNGDTRSFEGERQRTENGNTRTRRVVAGNGNGARRVTTTRRTVNRPRRRAR